MNTALLNAYNSYTTARAQFRKRICFNVDEIYSNCDVIEIPDEPFLSLCILPNCRLAVGSKENFRIMDYSLLREGLSFQHTTCHKTPIPNFILTAVDTSRVVAENRLYNLNTESYVEFEQDEEPILNICCYDQRYILYISYSSVKCFDTLTSAKSVLATDSYYESLYCFETLDNNRIAIGGVSRSIAIYDLTTGVETKMLAQEYTVTCMIYLEDNKLLVANKNALALWNIENESMKLRVRFEVEVTHLVYLSQDYVLCPCDNGDFYIISTLDLSIVDLIRHRICNRMNQVELLDDGRLVAITENGKLLVWQHFAYMRSSIRLLDRLKSAVAYCDCTITFAIE